MAFNKQENQFTKSMFEMLSKNTRLLRLTFNFKRCQEKERDFIPVADVLQLIM